MNPVQKNKSIQRLEEHMQSLEPESFRYKVLDSAKHFKSSWIELGQYLFTVYKDKLFRDWGFLTFEAYCAKEVGVKQMTAMKLLKSYSFLEHEEPEYLKSRSLEATTPTQIPSYESVNALRLAKASERLPASEYRQLRDEVLEDAKEEGEVKKKIRYVLKNNAPKATEQDQVELKTRLAKKMLLQLIAAKNEMGLLNFPNKVVKQVDTLIELLEDFQQ